MAQKSIPGSSKLAGSIKLRRNELGLTIEEAAAKAGVGTKTWSRYEAGESIRNDKVRGICKALNWHDLPQKSSSNTLDFDEYKNHEAWSPYLAKRFGVLPAASFVIGSDILLDNVEEDMEALSHMPRGSHIGQIHASWLKMALPSQFLMRYDYEFLHALRDRVNRFRLQASVGIAIIARSVEEELVLYLVVEESRFLMESLKLELEDEDTELEDGWDQWIFKIFDDMDLITFLYSDSHLTADNPYHFDHWLERQFYCE